MRKKELEIREFIRHYSESYVRVKRKKKGKDSPWEFAFFSGGDYETASNIPISLSIEGKRLIENLPDIEIDTSFPKFGLYPHKRYGACALLVSRYPARQWRWGVCRNNIAFHNVFSKNVIFTDALNVLLHTFGERLDQKYLLVSSISFDEEIAKSILMPEYVSYEKAIERVGNYQVGVEVVSREMMVSVSPYGPELLLWKYDVPIARLDVSKNPHKISMTVPMFYQEVLDFYSRQGISNVEIENK